MPRPACERSSQDFKRMRPQAFLLLLMAMAAAAFSGGSSAKTLHIGFLSSEPDWAIPESLSLEWQSAFQVAVQVLNSEARDSALRLEGVWERCGCDWTSAQNAAARLVEESRSKGGPGALLGVVGPACSQAAAAAAKVLQEHQIPLVSFAATAARLSNRDLYPNLFRTVYSDDHQASSIAAMVNQLQATNVTIVYTNDAYSLPLAQQIRSLCDGNVFRMELLEMGVNATLNSRQIDGMFNAIEPYTFLVLALQPSVATQMWELVLKLGKASYPWWYLGSDGVTAVDITQEGSGRLEGEIGIAPYGGDPSDELVCQKFYEHWSERQQEYPGFASNRSTSYVPYLIDAVTSLFEAANQASAQGIAAVNASSVLAALRSGRAHKGCTGSVEFDPDTGSRLVTSSATVYELVSYAGSTWQLKGRIVNGRLSSLQPVTRPGTFPANSSAAEVYYVGGEDKGRKNSKVNAALVAAILVLCTAFIVVSVSLVCYHKLRHNSPLTFFRMQH
ncbi:metabotropic glutamate receptor-like protein E [Selaginella moellendorffii]|uniref:metabotropic glutamate receptor-like protein E n=1 Tax=Selaginella moellendorffii TaxID=88036 RepID=UPI000D1CD0ED|nr:metabotropic glutamate receptor-like protein E [Selaginella moellendorffii]|eukprot:XP_024523936.1 metabotropic glutamate receptor-like protein E [Selaginella moellendorffii]